MSGVSVVRSPAMPQVQPSLVDRAIAHIARRHALRRYESKVKLDAAARFFGGGGYQGARTDRPALKEWRPGNPSADGATSADLPPSARGAETSSETLRSRWARSTRTAPALWELASYPIPESIENFLASRKKKQMRGRNRAGHGMRRMVLGNILAATDDPMVALSYIGDEDIRQLKKYDKRKQQRIEKASAALQEANESER